MSARHREADLAMRTLLPRIKGIQIEAAELGTLLCPGGPRSLRVPFRAGNRSLTVLPTEPQDVRNDT